MATTTPRLASWPSASPTKRRHKNEGPVSRHVDRVRRGPTEEPQQRPAAPIANVRPVSAAVEAAVLKAFANAPVDDETRWTLSPAAMEAEGMVAVSSPPVCINRTSPGERPLRQLKHRHSNNIRLVALLAAGMGLAEVSEKTGVYRSSIVNASFNIRGGCRQSLGQLREAAKQLSSDAQIRVYLRQLFMGVTKEEALAKAKAVVA